MKILKDLPLKAMKRHCKLLKTPVNAFAATLTFARAALCSDQVTFMVMMLLMTFLVTLCLDVLMQVVRLLMLWLMFW